MRFPFGKQPEQRVEAPERAGSLDRVPAATAQAIIVEVFGPLCGGMTQLGPGAWVTDLSDGARATLDLDPYKGGDYEFHYGVSCAWVPRVDAGRFAWKRTLKQTRRCLWVTHFTVDAPPRTAMNTLRGERALRVSAERALESLAPRADRFWQSVADPDGVLTEARRQEAPIGLGHTIHSPRPGLVTAFTMAKLGDVEAAQQHLVEHGGLHGDTQIETAFARLNELLADQSDSDPCNQ